MGADVQLDIFKQAAVSFEFAKMYVSVSENWILGAEVLP